MNEPLFLDSREALAFLEKAGSFADEDLDVFEIALALAVQEHPGKSVDQYRQHLNKLAAQTLEEYQRLQEEDKLPQGVDTQILALRHTMNMKQGYTGDELRYDDLQNADIMRVIDRRMGMPIALGIIAMAIGKKIDWPIYGLNFPGHFLIRFDGDRGQRIILDPFHLFDEIEAHTMRKLLKDNLGEGAELSASYYEATGNRDILIRLQNNIKFRLIDAEDYTKALACAQLMKLIAPNEHRLLFDEGILLARLDRPSAAIEVLRLYIEKEPKGKDRMQALSIINELNAILN